MHIALVIYGSLDEVSGGFLYDRKLVEHLQQRGHEVTVIPLPWRSYGWSLVNNSSHHLLRRSQYWPVWQQRLYRWVERRYLTTLDGCVYANRHIAARVVPAQLGTI